MFSIAIAAKKVASLTERSKMVLLVPEVPTWGEKNYPLICKVSKLHLGTIDRDLIWHPAK